MRIIVYFHSIALMSVLHTVPMGFREPVSHCVSGWISPSRQDGDSFDTIAQKAVVACRHDWVGLCGSLIRASGGNQVFFNRYIALKFLVCEYVYGTMIYRHETMTSNHRGLKSYCWGQGVPALQNRDAVYHLLETQAINPSTFTRHLNIYAHNLRTWCGYLTPEYSDSGAWPMQEYPLISIDEVFQRALAAADHAA